MTPVDSNPGDSDLEPMTPESQQRISSPSRAVGFRRAVLRGLGVVLPPLLTIVVLIWAWKTVESYVLRPIESGIRHSIVFGVEETYASPPEGSTKDDNERWLDGFVYDGKRFVPDPTRRRFLPEEVKKLVDEETDYFGPYAPRRPARMLIGIVTSN